MSDLYFGSDLFDEFDRLQSQTTSLFGAFRPAIGPATSGLFCRSTSAPGESIKIVAFAPWINPAKTRRPGRQGFSDGQRRAHSGIVLKPAV
ncbi:hypothetical protein [Paraburkholderia sediminicola]|uniref:hypothetical protein n=1 Tax=Paraburkholderia sediminicola TaxID=458836 RepID=UPI0038B6D4F6